MSITIKRGDTFEADIWFDIDGVPQDLTGWTIRSQIRGTDQAATLLINFPITETDLPAGNFKLIADFATVKQWQPGAYEWDIEYTSPDGFRISSPTERITVVRDVTRTEPA